MGATVGGMLKAGSADLEIAMGRCYEGRVGQWRLWAEGGGIIEYKSLWISFHREKMGGVTCILPR